MPLGFERINARVKQPNDHVNFIKPLEGQDKAVAQDMLERLAAICNPIMKKNHIYVMSLEEYEPNTEFWGRNFNAGEVIQLVLKAPLSGNWLSFEFVQMVLMHELAHCKQMNHSGAFWKVRNAYSDELKALWARGYTGEGMWSRGILLATGQFTRQSRGDQEIQPKQLCGGTFRSSGKRKRKEKPKVSYKERQQRRIAKKFGANGVALGADEDAKRVLENGKKSAGKPRVAGSNRGRELRAAAALARFEVKEEPVAVDHEAETESDGSTDSAGEEDEPREAVDINGKKLLDAKGRGMVKVCEDENKNDINAQDEMSELQDFFDQQRDTNFRGTKAPDSVKRDRRVQEVVDDSEATASEEEPLSKERPRNLNSTDSPLSVQVDTAKMVQKSAVAKTSTCTSCSMENEVGAPTCIVCANVIDPRKVPSIWKCSSEACFGGIYVNAGDCGVCGVCGARKSS